VEIILIIILMWFIIICVLRLLKAIIIWLIVFSRHKQALMIKKVFTLKKVSSTMIDNIKRQQLQALPLLTV
jgi:hypothetical protein